MKSAFLTVLTFVYLTAALSARIGDDKAQLKLFYGEPTFDLATEEGSYQTFDFQGKLVIAILVDGVSVLEFIRIPVTKPGTDVRDQTMVNEAVPFITSFLTKNYGWTDELPPII